MVPLFIVFRTLGMIDTYTSLILTHMLVGLPFIVWVMVPFFESIPRELTEAAVVDGASALRAFVTVVLPLSGLGHCDGVDPLFCLFLEQLYVLNCVSVQSHAYSASGHLQFYLICTD